MTQYLVLVHRAISERSAQVLKDFSQYSLPPLHSSIFSPSHSWMSGSVVALLIPNQNSPNCVLVAIEGFHTQNIKTSIIVVILRHSSQYRYTKTKILLFHVFTVVGTPHKFCTAYWSLRDLYYILFLFQRYVAYCRKWDFIIHIF